MRSIIEIWPEYVYCIIMYHGSIPNKFTQIQIQMVVARRANCRLPLILSELTEGYVLMRNWFCLNNALNRGYEYVQWSVFLITVAQNTWFVTILVIVYATAQVHTVSSTYIETRVRVRVLHCKPEIFTLHMGHTVFLHHMRITTITFTLYTNPYTYVPLV